MADSHTDASPNGSKLSRLAKDQWLFPKSIAAVLGGFVVLVFALSPSIYLPSLRNTPEALSAKAEQLANEKKFEEAIEAYNEVLRFEERRLDVFSRADRNIQKIKELMRLREKQGHEDAEIEEVGGGAAEETDEDDEDASDEEETSEEEEPDADEKAPETQPVTTKGADEREELEELEKQPDAEERSGEPDLTID